MAAEEWQKDCGQVTREQGSRAGVRVQEVGIVEQNSEASVLDSSEGGRDIADLKAVDCTDVNSQALFACQGS